MRTRKGKKQLAFVLAGGGARGALQVGALRAVLEAGFQPDLLVGTSIGAINAAYLAVRGVTLDSIAALAKDWRDAAIADLMPTNYVGLTMRALFNRSRGNTYVRMREFVISHGLAPDLRFGDIQSVRLFVVAADLNAGCLVLYGDNPEQNVLEAVLASAALPPWIPPIAAGEQLLIDGGAISNLPIEPALTQGATEIIALDLDDSREVPNAGNGFLPLLIKLMNMVYQRQRDLEMALAAASSVPVRHIALYGEMPVAIWDFSRSTELIARGYDMARREIAQWQGSLTEAMPKPWWRKWLARLGQAAKPSAGS